jgi:hypothetical protein
MTISQSPHTAGRAESPQTSHLNLRWSIADMDRIAAMARARNSAHHIATCLGCTSSEIIDVCRRNGILIVRV